MVVLEILGFGLTKDTLKIQDEAKSNDYLNKLKEEDNYEEIKEALNPQDYNLIVTPKEIDELMEDLSKFVANGINIAL